MAPSTASSSDEVRPSAARAPLSPQTSTRDRSDPKKPTTRAHTFHSTSTIHQPHDRDHEGISAPDAFDTAQVSDGGDDTEPARRSIELDELPIELVTLTDSFIESLSAKVHSTPPDITKLAQLFQDFYTLASTRIATHINALATKQSRDASPAASISSSTSRFRTNSNALSGKGRSKSDGVEQQMITADELTERKKRRRALEVKRGLLEEAVERRLCEGIYDRIYRHRSTQDEAQDDKLRSKTAALAVVGIGLADLGIETGEEPGADADDTAETTTDKTNTIRDSLSSARTDLTHMTESRYPLGKLNDLKAAHKSIVDTLAQFHPSASADEIMPMLIYTLITMKPENLNIISDLHFMQNFRWEQKLNGEAAYCLTNLEAAISFLQSVDLATLRADEHPSGPPKNSGQSGTPRAETFPPAYSQGLTVPSQSTSEAFSETATASKPTASSSGLKAANVLRNRRLSDLVNTPAQAIGAASDAVFSTADQGLKTISSSLGDSYTFLLGKFRERQEGPKESIAVPRTLDDARKLVSTPPPEEDDNASGTSSAVGAEDAEHLKGDSVREDRVLNMIGGRRDQSVDSARSGRSGRSAGSSLKGVLTDDSKGSVSAASAGQAPAMLDQVRSIGISLGPMARLPSIGMIRGFGRNVSSSTPTPPTSKDTTSATAATKATDGGDLSTAFPDIAAALPPKDIPKLAPPNKRFMEIQTPGELKLGEVLDLLRDYRRLAGALKSIGAFEETK